MRRSIKLVGALAFAALALAACEDGEQLDDAPVGVIDDSPVFVMTNVDQFPNVAVKCYEGNGIYTTTRDYGDAITIIVGDPACADNDPTPRKASK
jgi:hypothetical protein